MTGSSRMTWLHCTDLVRPDKPCYILGPALIDKEKQKKKNNESNWVEDRHYVAPYEGACQEARAVAGCHKTGVYIIALITLH